jgi:hypothetical protein
MFIINLLRSISLCFHSGDFYRNLYFKDKKIRFLPVFLILAITNFITVFIVYSLIKTTIIANADAIENVHQIEFHNKKTKYQDQESTFKNLRQTYTFYCN